MIKKFKDYLLNKTGMTLVEVLTAMTILALVVFCFAPLMLSYLQTINIAGQKMERLYKDAGNLEVLLGKNSLNGNYTVSIDTVPIKLTSPDTAIVVDGNTKTYATATIESNVRAYGLTSGGTFSKDNEGIASDDGTVNISTGPSTFYTDKAGSSSGITLFPSSLTDDFKVAHITIYSPDINFVLDQCEFVTTGPTSEIKLTKGVDYDLKYHPDANPSDKNMLLLTVYGGGDKISFETSPLVFKHLGQRYEIQIDAPTMIMVGEKAPDDNYYYYVSRGEIDDDGSLLIHRRVMSTASDPKSGESVKLTSAMNDVEWVPAESGDGNNVDSNGEKYGYYVMCGDNGQIRRFWKRPNTTITVDGKTVEVNGNYYWGGDYTYYTDYNFNRFRTPNYIYSTDKSGNVNPNQVYSTDTSFKFISQRSMTEKQHGFNMGSKEYSLVGSLVNTSTGLLRGLSVVSVTYSDDAEFYATDGQIYFFQSKGDHRNGLPNYNQMTSIYGGNMSYGGKDLTLATGDVKQYTHEAWGWMTANTGSYYEINGVNKSKINEASYPITLTSVDAIQITGTGGSHKTDVTKDGSYYFTSAGDGDTSAENATTNMNYPQSSYTLYCGYIPAMMDIFAEQTGAFGSWRYPAKWEDHFANTANGTFSEIDAYSNIGRAENRKTLQDNADYYTKWRMTLGVTPYYNDGANKVNIDQNVAGKIAYYKYNRRWTYPYEHVVYYPYTNLEYAITGKFYDEETYKENYSVLTDKLNLVDGTTIANPSETVINTYESRQTHLTNGNVVDITVAYLSHPFATAVAANPTDDVVYDYGNNKDWGQVFFWNNRRETITFLDCASTMIPSGEEDIPVSLMVGYLLGGVVEYGAKADDFFANVGSVMNNGIVFLRAGDYNVAKQNAANAQTYEYLATDKTGYKLETESNVFHQFYYLNSRYQGSGFYSGEKPTDPSKGGHIGNLFGAKYWQNNRHIQYLSLYGGEPVGEPGADDSANYDYLRSHPMANTKVNCVAWGTTWNGNPEAMWGTENGTVLSWWVNLNQARNGAQDDWNDKSVSAEIQSYIWVDNCNARTFAAVSSEWRGTIGSAAFNSGSNAGAVFSPGSDRFKYFYDKGTQATRTYNSIGFISTLNSINDICYSNDYWIAVGDQSDRNPDGYCAPGSLSVGNVDAGTKMDVKPFSDRGSGSWVNVRYWVDVEGTGKHSDSNATYHWRAVKISDQKYCNIVQINNINGMWIATGYLDKNKNGEYDDGEPARMFWTYNPLLPCGTDGGWSDDVKMYDGNTEIEDAFAKMGGINSVATRDNV